MDGFSDSEGAPEELTFEQGTKKDEEIKALQRKNKARIAREKKERRRLWAQRKTPKEPHIEAVPESVDVGDDDHTVDIPGMLPQDVVNFLASREKQVFPSDSESEKETVEHEPISKKRQPKKSRMNTVLLKDLPPPQCALNSLEFLKKRKAQIPRSRAVLTNADHALRFLTSRGNPLSKN